MCVGVITGVGLTGRTRLHDVAHEAELTQDPEKPEISGVQCET